LFAVTALHINHFDLIPICKRYALHVIRSLVHLVFLSQEEYIVTMDRLLNPIILSANRKT